MMVYPEEAGYPVGGDFTVNYYMIEMHYDNLHQVSSKTDSLVNQKYCAFLDRHGATGIRFYIGNELRQHDVGYLTFRTDANARSLAIPSGVNRFVVDSYCPASASRVRISLDSKLDSTMTVKFFPIFLL